MEYYHNTRCTKSREGLALLEEKGFKPDIIRYMEDPLTPGQLKEILRKLNMEAIELIRTNEKVWKEEFKDKELSEEELILAMIEHPRLMQRPVLVNGSQARVGRPPEALLEILDAP